ncbi:MAG TPA: alpha/beta fold hydrolase [Candidatus Limnocylindrales bacterium]|nr:alpha/beta fold hydrolase [Candidatus Limnocylindrales bacterium]
MIEFGRAANPARDEPLRVGNGAGYLASPQQPNGAGVLVLHAWWGLNDSFRRIADDLAAEGYTALAPDCYGDGDPAQTIEDAQAKVDDMDMVNAEQVLLGAFDHLARLVPGRIGTVGFSLGSNLGLWLARKRPDRLAANVLYYGAGEGAEGRAPVLGHFATDVKWEERAFVEQMEKELRDSGRDVTFHWYEDADHWFAERLRDEYDPNVAALAWQRTLDFLGRHLLG